MGPLTLPCPAPSSSPLPSWPSLMGLLVARSPCSPGRVSSTGKEVQLGSLFLATLSSSIPRICLRAPPRSSLPS